MAELEYGNRDNLFNAMKTKAPSGETLDMTLNLVENNPILRDAPTYPANNGMSHMGYRWITLPTPTVSVIGGGWTASVAQGQNFREDMCLLRSRYQCPTDVLQHHSDAAAYRRAQEGTHLEGMLQGWCNTIIRGAAAADSTKIDGLISRAPWNTATTDFCVSMGGSSNLRSIWLINFGLTKFHLIYNKDHPTVGVTREPKPAQLVDASTTDTNATGYRWDEITEFEFEQGICINDDKAVKRIANIDYTATPSADLINYIIELRLIHDNFVKGQWFAYCDPHIYINLIQLAQSEMNVQYSSDNPYRISLPMVGDVIIRNMEALNYDEVAIA